MASDWQRPKPVRLTAVTIALLAALLAASSCLRYPREAQWLAAYFGPLIVLILATAVLLRVITVIYQRNISEGKI